MIPFAHEKIDGKGRLTEPKNKEENRGTATGIDNLGAAAEIEPAPGQTSAGA